jgi:hypothetical protein
VSGTVLQAQLRNLDALALPVALAAVRTSVGVFSMLQCSWAQDSQPSVDAQTAKLALNRKPSSIKYGCQTRPRSWTNGLESVRTFTCAFIIDTDPLDQRGSLTIAELWNWVRRSLRFSCSDVRSITTLLQQSNFRIAGKSIPATC